MKTEKDIQGAINEIRKVCEKHEIKLIGTCDSEGILGEITIMDISNKYGNNWEIPDRMNEVRGTIGIYLDVSGIG